MGSIEEIVVCGRKGDATSNSLVELLGQVGAAGVGDRCRAGGFGVCVRFAQHGKKLAIVFRLV